MIKIKTEIVRYNDGYEDIEEIQHTLSDGRRVLLQQSGEITLVEGLEALGYPYQFKLKLEDLNNE